MPDTSTMDHHIPRHNSRFWENFKNLDLLIIPRNLYLIDVFAYIMLLIIYTLYAANYDELHGSNDYLEGSMYLLILSFIITDIRLVSLFVIAFINCILRFYNIYLFILFVDTKIWN